MDSRDWFLIGWGVVGIIASQAFLYWPKGRGVPR